MATHHEKKQIRWAIRELMKEAGDFTGASGVLAQIAGLRYPAAERDPGPGGSITDVDSPVEPVSPLLAWPHHS